MFFRCGRRPHQKGMNFLTNGFHEDPGERAVVAGDAPLAWRSRGATTGCSASRRRCSPTTGTSFRLDSSGTICVSIVFVMVPRAARWEHVGVTRAALRICLCCIRVPRGRSFRYRPPAVHQLLYLVHRSARLFLQWVISLPLCLSAQPICMHSVASFADGRVGMGRLTV